MESVQKQLEELGLSPNEVRVYLASLELGAATVLQIAAKSAVVRPTAHVAVGALVKRGLVSSHTRGKKQYFQAERPGQLLRIVEEEKKKLADRESKLKSMLPGLESLILLSKEKPEVKYYEGLEGLEAMRKVLIDCKPKELYVIGTKPKHLGDAYQESHQVHGYRLKSLGVKMRIIAVNGDSKAFEKSKSYFGTKKGKQNLYEYKIMKAKNSFVGEIAVFKNHLSLIAYTDHPYGFLIKSPELEDTAKGLFEHIWSTLK